jgi:hypothetical protein
MRTVIIGLFVATLIASCKGNSNNDQPLSQNEEATEQSNIVDNNAPSQNLSGAYDETSEINRMYLTEEELKNEIAQRKKRATTSETTNGFYPEGSERKLTEYDIQYLSAWGHKVMLNEIYARHGMIFKDEMLQRHFKRQKWYKPVGYNVFNTLTKIEKQNVTFLINTEPQPL